jgi:hypothetical protein
MDTDAHGFFRSVGLASLSITVSKLIYVYILQSLKDGGFYTGYSDDLKRRFALLAKPIPAGNTSCRLVSVAAGVFLAALKL